MLALLVAALVAAAQAAPPDTAAEGAALRDYARACARDGGRLWGRSLCGNLLLVDPATRRAVGTGFAGTGFAGTGFAGIGFAGTLPESVTVANTSVRWAGADWAMVLLPLPRDRFARLQLLAHESFHREQPALGFPAASPVSPHLDERDGRLWLRLELRAWAAALRARGGDARPHVLDALRFRARRHARYPAADSLEATLERHEGLAEYTGARLALDATGLPPARVADDLAAFERRTTYVRSFAYATGPALGLLLDRFAPGWRPRVRETPDLARALAAAVRWDAAPEPEATTGARAARYGGPAVAAEEDARAAERARHVAALRALLVDGPALVLPMDAVQMAFDPNNVLSLDTLGTVYPTGTFRGAWGTLRLAGDGGVLVARDFRTLRVAAPSPADSAARPLRGTGWTLELAPGWALRPSAARAGDVEVVRGR
jgi:hypothetical protein